MPEEAALYLGEELLGLGAEEAFAAAAPEIGGALTGEALGGAALAEGALAPEITAETIGAMGAGDAALGAGAFGDVAASAPTTVDLSGLGATAPTLPSAPATLPTVDMPVESTGFSPQISQPTVSDVQGDFSTTTTEPTGKTTQGPDTTEPDLNYRNVTPPTDAQNPVMKALQSLGITSPTGGLGQNAFSAAGLGLNVASQLAANKQKQSLQQQLQRQSDITAPAAKQLMTQFQSGTIGAAQEKQITDYTNNQRAQIKQRYARMGRDPNLDSAAQQEMANVDVQAAAMRDAALQNVLSSGLKAAGVSAGPAQQAILAGYNQDQSAQKTQADFLKALADMQARAGTGTQTTPTAPAAV
jgi:hypothetical protein